MEWSIKANEMFCNEITKISSSLIPAGFVGDVSNIRDYNVSYRLMQESVARVVDDLGAQSADAQSLTKVITTAEKLRTADNHTLYLYKDANAQDGAGRVVGLLKVGRKHLFLADAEGRVIEVEPLCVLDFFVVPACQRGGVGKKLFDHMLQDQGTEAHRLAIDGPSDYMAAFLRHKYNMPHLIRQNNNFAVAPQFFEHIQPNNSKSGANTPAAAVGRYTARQPHSSIANVIHGGGGASDSAQSHANRLQVSSQERDADWRPRRRSPAPPAPPAPPSPRPPH